MCKQLVCDAEIENSKIDARLVCRVKRAAITCKGFSEVQKANLAAIFKMAPVEAGLPPFADMWVFKCIGAKRALAQDVLLVSFDPSLSG